MVTDSTHKMDPMDPMDPMDVRDYAEALGWVPVKEAYERRLYVLKHPAHERRQLAFPMDATAPDCAEAIEVAIERLAELSGVSQRVVVNRLWGLREDTVRVRVLSDGRAGQSIPLAFASSMLQGAQQLLLSAAHNVLEAKPHHPRLSRAEAVRLVEAAQFRHTEQGSFVVKVSCPLQAGELDPVQNARKARCSIHIPCQTRRFPLREGPHCLCFKGCRTWSKPSNGGNRTRWSSGLGRL